MPKVKVVAVESRYLGDDNYADIIRSSVTDWEEVTDEELKVLRTPSYLHRMFLGEIEYPYTPTLIIDMGNVPIKERLHKLKDLIAEDKRKEAERQAAYLRKKEEKAAQREHMRKKNEEKLYAELKAKFERGDGGGE